jgi:hypothetical protein
MEEKLESFSGGRLEMLSLLPKGKVRGRRKSFVASSNCRRSKLW